VVACGKPSGRIVAVVMSVAPLRTERISSLKAGSILHLRSEFIGNIRLGLPGIDAVDGPHGHAESHARLRPVAAALAGSLSALAIEAEGGKRPSHVIS